MASSSHPLPSALHLADDAGADAGPSSHAAPPLSPDALALDRAVGGHAFATPADAAAIAAQRRAAVALVKAVGRDALRGRGVDVTRITLPVAMFAPLTALQRVGDEVAWWGPLLAAAAAAAGDPVERTRWVGAAAVSSLRAAAARAGKPFNPTLGETWTGRGRAGGVEVWAEQVSHHPPVSAWLARGPGWTAAAAPAWSARTAGPNGVVTRADGAVTVRFEDDGATAAWRPPPTIVSGVLVGRRVVRHAGPVTVVCTAPGSAAPLATLRLTVGPPAAGLDADPATAPLAHELRARAAERAREGDSGGGGGGGGARDRDAGALRGDEVAGVLTDATGAPVDVVLGSWLTHVDVLGRPPAPPPAPGRPALFGRHRRRAPPPPSPHTRRLWDATVTPPEEVDVPPSTPLLPSDSRWRRDVRALAAGDADGAAAAKAAIEEWERAAARARAEG